MARIAFETPEFRADFRRASRQLQGRIESFLQKFDEDASRSGLDLKPPKTAGDPRVRTARVDQGTRAVLVDLGHGDYVLHRVMEHDAAYNFAGRLRPDVSSFNGLPRLMDLPEVPTGAPAQASGLAKPDLFAHRRDRDFEAVGVPPFAVTALRAMASAADVEGFADYLGGRDPLLGIAILSLLDPDKSVDEIYSELLTLTGGPEPDAVRPDGVYNGLPEAEPERPEFDTDDLGAALVRPGADERFRVVEDSSELIDALRGDFADWQVFLHPLQRRAAYGSPVRGPFRVSGGAGTGKTVVLIHRVKALLDRANPDLPPRILVTTFTPHLKLDLLRLLRQLVGDRADLVDIRTVDGLARELHHEMSGERVEEIQPEAENALWSELAEQSEYSSAFLRGEYRHVCLARGIRSLDEYVTTSRLGRGTPLRTEARRAVWPIFEAFETKTRGRGRFTALQLTESVAGLLAKLPTPLYDHVLVDEAQDLHASQWRLLRSIVAEGDDDLFIVGDAFQRIYGDSVSLRSLGIETRGRSLRLRRNYRTTHETAAWALHLIGSETVVDIDEMGADLSGYHSVRHGPELAVRPSETRPEELDGLVERIQAWLDLGYEPHAIAVTARSQPEATEIVRALQQGGLAAAPLGRGGRVEDAVNVATMHRLKGLEYLCVAATGLSAEAVPPPGAVCEPGDDIAQHRTDMQAERSLVYVAVTRARDEAYVSWSGRPSLLLPDLVATEPEIARTT